MSWCTSGDLSSPSAVTHASITLRSLFTPEAAAGGGAVHEQVVQCGRKVTVDAPGRAPTQNSQVRRTISD